MTKLFRYVGIIVIYIEKKENKCLENIEEKN